MLKTSFTKVVFKGCNGMRGLASIAAKSVQPILLEKTGGAWNVIRKADEGVSLVQAVSSDFELDSGLAKQFRFKFGRDALEEFQQKGYQMGDVARQPYKDANIFYLVTKEHWFERSNYKALRQALSNLRKECEANNVTQLAMGRLCNGKDGLDWFVIRDMITQAFGDSEITVLAYVIR